MTAKEKEVAEEYSNALADLNINSKPLINMLTMLADENSAYAPIIVQCIERQLHKVQADSKLPVLYLIDSVIKNIGPPYITLFVQNIEKLFASTFIKVDEKTRANMFKLRSTWNDVIVSTKLHELDVIIHAIDKNWPISAAPSNIHVNPKFLNNVNHSETPKVVPIQPFSNEVDEAILREKLIKKQKEFIELQQKKLELELLQTKTQIEIQKKKMNKIHQSKNSSNVIASSSNLNVSPSNEELYGKKQTLSENPQRITENPVNNIDIPITNSESPSMPIKIIVSPSKKFQPTSIPSAQQPFVSQQQTPVVVGSSPFLSVNQQIAKINPVSTQLLQTLNRDPRLRKGKNAVKPSTFNDELKQPVFKNKDDKKLDKPKRDNSKHRDTKRKERSPINSPSKKELLRKSHKKTDRREKSSRDEKYHKRRADEKKSKELELKNKNISSNVKTEQNENILINRELTLKGDDKLLMEEPKNDNISVDLSIVETKEKDIPKDRDVITEVVNEVKLSNLVNVSSELAKTESPLEDSDSLKRLHMYMQTMKKSPEPSTVLTLELKNDVCAEKNNQSMLTDVIITQQNDIDLRVIPPTMKRNSDSIKNDDIEPTAKKNKSDIIDELFGAEDVDLRTAKITQPVNGNGTDIKSTLEVTANIEKPLIAENFSDVGPWNMVNKKPSDVSGSDSDCSSKSSSTGSEESKRNNKKSDSEERPPFKRRKTFKRNEKENSKNRTWRNNKNWNPRSENEPRFSQNRIEPWSRGPRPNYSHSTKSLVPPPMYEVPGPTTPFASSSPDWTVPVIPPSDPVILDMIAHDTTQSINIDGVSREVRFYGPTAITFVSWDDPREIYFQGPPKNVIFDDLFSVLCHFNTPDREFLLDCQPHRVRLGAPTRELYLDGKFYECYFGGSPIFTDLGGVKRSVKLEGPPPSVNIGTTKRQDLVAGRITIVVDNTYNIPVYLDAKPQRIDVGNMALILRFIDGLMRAMINDQPFKVNYNGPPQAIIVRGNKHYLRFTGLPPNIRPGYAAISQMMGVVLADDTTTESLPPMPAPPMPPSFTGFDMPILTSLEDNNQIPSQSYSSKYSLAPTTSTVPLIPNISKLEPVTSPFVPPLVAPTPTVPPVLPSNMDINELFKKLVDSGIVPKDKPKDVVQPKIKKKEKETESLIVKLVDFSDPSSLKQKQPGLIHNLYTGIQCSSCGIRFTAEFTIKYSSHLDWHFRKNRREKMASKTVQSRKWYYDTSDWCKYEEQEDETTRAASWFDLQAEQGAKDDEHLEEENVPCVPAGENSELAACYLCHDQFEQFYNEKDEEWQLKNCIEKDKRLYHPMCFDDMTKTREEIIRKRNEAIEEAKRLEIQKLENQQLEIIKLEVKEELQSELKISEDKIKLNDEDNNEIDLKLEQETILKKENEEQIIEENVIKTETISVEPQPQPEENSKKNIYEDLEIPDTMEIIQVTEVSSPKLIDEPVVEYKKPSSPLIVQESLPDDIKPKSPSPVSTMTCSIDGNTDTEWNVPVAPAMGTIKININQKITPVIKPPVEDISVEKRQSPPDFSSTFDEIDPDQPPPPGLEMETVIAPKIQRELKPRLMHNVKKLKEYPIVNKGRDMSGLCSIM